MNPLAVVGGLIVWFAASIIAAIIWSATATYFKKGRNVR